MEQLALKLDNNDPQTEEAMTYFENEILRILEL